MLTPVILNKYQSINNKDYYNIDMRTSDDLKTKFSNINFGMISPEKIKSNPSFSLDRLCTRTIEIAKTSLLPDIKKK